MSTQTTAPSMEEAHALLDNLTKYDAVADTAKALTLLREVVDGTIEVTQERLNAISMLYQVANQREQLALHGLQVAAQMKAAGVTDESQH